MERRWLRARTIPAIIGSLAVLAFSSCRLPTSGSAPIEVHSESITLHWQPADPGQVPFIAAYRVSYRAHPAGGWVRIAEVPPSSAPQLRVDHSLLGDGAFDFGVSAVGPSGVESALHISTDPSADPAGGWFLLWTFRR